MTMIYYKGDGKYITSDGVELEKVELVDHGYRLAELLEAREQQRLAAQWEAAEGSQMRTDVAGCSSCGLGHENMLFIELREPNDRGCTHFGQCPVSGEFVLLKTI